MKGVVISLFDVSGEMVKPWANAGYECHLFDIQNKNEEFEIYGSGEIRRHEADLSEPDQVIWVIKQRIRAGKKVVFVSAFPPCTHLSISGARWMKGKGLRALEESIGYFATASEICEEYESPYVIENPMSTISTYWREPDYKFHPAWYQGYTEDFCDYTKETWLWTGGGFVMPPRIMEPGLISDSIPGDITLGGGDYQHDYLSGPDKTYIHHQSPGKDRANIRSKTPPGFPEAVYQANKPEARAA